MAKQKWLKLFLKAFFHFYIIIYGYGKELCNNNNKGACYFVYNYLVIKDEQSFKMCQFIWLWVLFVVKLIVILIWQSIEYWIEYWKMNYEYLICQNIDYKIVFGYE